MTPIQAAELAHQIADRACIADIETEAVPTCVDGMGWLDVRCMLDRREMCDQAVEMNTQALSYAQWRGLFVCHPDHPYLVRIKPEHAL
jgi:hypothetical protein